MKVNRRVHSKEFKEQAVQLVETSDKPISEIADGLGINASMLRRWCRESHESGENRFPGQGHRQPGTD